MSNILLLSTSGGSGHIQAALAKKEALLENDPSCNIFEVNLSDDWWTWFGKFALNLLWNIPQRRGMVRWQKFIWKQQNIASYFFGPATLFNALRFFLYHDIDRIIITHQLCYRPLFWALDLAKLFGRKTPKLEIIVIELPTMERMYFYDAFKKLKPKDFDRIEVHTAKPLMQEGLSDAEHWLQVAGLPFRVIKYVDPPLRKSFYISTPALTYHVAGKHLTSKDRVLTLMLGSMPTVKSMIQYVQAMQELDLDYIFAMCSQNEKLKTKLDGLKLSNVVTLGPQPASTIADLIIHSTYTLTRSGAITSQELMRLSGGQILIHSETGDLSGMPEWEGGNALYLMQKKGAKLVSPNSLKSELGISQTPHSLPESDSDNTRLDLPPLPQKSL